jgi:hypothetical protein
MGFTREVSRALGPEQRPDQPFGGRPQACCKCITLQRLRVVALAAGDPSGVRIPRGGGAQSVDRLTADLSQREPGKVVGNGEGSGLGRRSWMCSIEAHDLAGEDRAGHSAKIETQLKVFNAVIRADPACTSIEINRIGPAMDGCRRPVAEKCFVGVLGKRAKLHHRVLQDRLVEFSVDLLDRTDRPLGRSHLEELAVNLEGAWRHCIVRREHGDEAVLHKRLRLDELPDQSLPGLEQERHPRIIGQNLTGDGHGCVGRAVVGEEDSLWRLGLRQDRLERLSQVELVVVAKDQECEFHILHEKVLSWDHESPDRGLTETSRVVHSVFARGATATPRWSMVTPGHASGAERTLRAAVGERRRGRQPRLEQTTWLASR